MSKRIPIGGYHCQINKGKNYACYTKTAIACPRLKKYGLNTYTTAFYYINSTDEVCLDCDLGESCIFDKKVEPRSRGQTRIKDISVTCPKCNTIETLQVYEGILQGFSDNGCIRSGHWFQRGKLIYHQPCNAVASLIIY